MSSYLHPKFLPFIDKESVKIIVECGSRDCLDAIALNEYYLPDKLFSFECNPESIIECNKNLLRARERNPIHNNIKLIERAVSNSNGTVNFYATDMENSKDKNIGASSLLVHCDQKNYIQKQIRVDALRLDTFMYLQQLQHIDLLCMDLQGAEHLAIKGIGHKIRNIHYILTEVHYRTFYHNSWLFGNLTARMQRDGFDLKTRESKRGPFTNVLYVNRDYRR